MTWDHEFAERLHRLVTQDDGSAPLTQDQADTILTMMRSLFWDLIDAKLSTKTLGQTLILVKPFGFRSLVPPDIDEQADVELGLETRAAHTELARELNRFSTYLQLLDEAMTDMCQSPTDDQNAGELAGAFMRQLSAAVEESDDPNNRLTVGQDLGFDV